MNPSNPTRPTFQAFEVALELVESLHPLLRELARVDPDLARQLRRAASSVALNIGEGGRRQGRDRMHLFRIAAGSADEVVAALRVASAWRYLAPDAIAPALALADRVLAMLWRLGARTS